MKAKRCAVFVGTGAVAVAIGKWGWILLFLCFIAIASVTSMFEEDFHPWEESLNDLGEISLDTKAAVDTLELSAMAVATRDKVDDCGDLSIRLGHQKTFPVNAETYCKIRIRTSCSCQGGGYDRGGNWMKVHITRGPNRGRDGWVCESAVGRTSVPF